MIGAPVGKYSVTNVSDVATCDLTTGCRFVAGVRPIRLGKPCIPPTHRRALLVVAASRSEANVTDSMRDRGDVPGVKPASPEPCIGSLPLAVSDWACQLFLGPTRQHRWLTERIRRAF